MKKGKKEVLANSFITSSHSLSEKQQIGVGQNLISAVGEVVLSQMLGGFAGLKPNLRPLTSRSAEALLTFSNPHDDSGAARGWLGWGWGGGQKTHSEFLKRISSCVSIHASDVLSLAGKLQYLQEPHKLGSSFWRLLWVVAVKNMALRLV